MADIDLTTGIGGAVPHNAAAPRVVRKQIDFKEEGAASGDVIKAIPVKAGTLVLTTLARVLRVADDTGACPFVVGDGDDPNGFDTDGDLKAAVDTVTKTGLALSEGAPNTLVDAYAGGRYYAADDTIDVTPTYTNADFTDQGKIELTVLMIEAVNAEDLAS